MLRCFGSQQIKYVVWRDGVVVPSQETGSSGVKGRRVAVLGPVLPDSDPGRKVIHRWRKRLCTKGDISRGRDTGAVLRTMKINTALASSAAAPAVAANSWPLTVRINTPGGINVPAAAPHFDRRTARIEAPPVCVSEREIIQ